MDAQSLLVRYFRCERNRFVLNMAKRDRDSVWFTRGMASLLLLLVIAVKPEQVHAQGFAPQAGVVQQGYYSAPSVDTGYAAPLDAAAYATLVPDRRVSGFEGTPPLRSVFRDHFGGSWIRLDYWDARIGHAGGRHIGTTIGDLNGNLLKNPSQPFDVPVLPMIGVPAVTTIPGVAPTSDGVDWDNIGGIKGTFGIPIDSRSHFEATFRGLEEQQTSLIAPAIPALTSMEVFGTIPPQVVVIPYTLDGQPGSLTDIPTTAIVYDADFFSQYTTNFWAADANYVYDLRIPNDGWTLQSIIGWRHEEYSERLTFGGTFDNRSDFATDTIVNSGILATPQSNQIDSKVHNFRHALQFGFRSELKTHRITFGVEPKVALGVGLIRSRVNTQNAREPGNLSSLLQDPNLIIDDPASTTSFDRELDFAPSAELNLYAKLDVTEWMKLRVGFDLLWLGRVGAADRSLHLNTISPVDPTMEPAILDFGVDQRLSNRYITAFTVGGEILLP